VCVCACVHASVEGVRQTWMAMSDMSAHGLRITKSWSLRHCMRSSESCSGTLARKVLTNTDLSPSPASMSPSASLSPAPGRCCAC
jgi:hypothetical protein